MPYSRPTVFPDIALNDVNNGLLGAPNVQEPPSDLKNDGWDYGQKPEREFFNWYGRVTNNWIKYLDETVTSILATLTNLADKSKNKTAADADNYFRSQW
jgi:hypothetical protein